MVKFRFQPIEDFDLTHRTVIVNRSFAETRQAGVLPISKETVKVIRRLIAARHPDWLPSAPVFCSYDGKRMKERSLINRLRVYSKKLGVNVTPYHLHYSFSVILLRNGGHAFSLQHTLSYSTMGMTKRYVNLVEKDLAEQYKIASPLNTLLNEGRRVKKIKK